jgi:quercetin dioxygenase-like cupin family protein
MSGKRTTAKRGPAMSLAIATSADPKHVAGRRHFFKYRDLEVAEASAGRMRAQVMSAEAGLSEPTGWHYHACEMQFVYVLEGWCELEFADRPRVRLEEGDSAMIPGGVPHQEVRTSETMRLLEVCIPADMGTVPCDPPATTTDES